MCQSCGVASDQTGAVISEKICLFFKIIIILAREQTLNVGHKLRNTEYENGLLSHVFALVCYQLRQAK